MDGVKNTVILAVDHSAAALKAAVEEIGGRKEAVVRFIHAEAQNLATSVNEQVDAVIYCNSIHYVAEKAELVRQIKDRFAPRRRLRIQHIVLQRFAPARHARVLPENG